MVKIPQIINMIIKYKGFIKSKTNINATKIIVKIEIINAFLFIYLSFINIILLYNNYNIKKIICQNKKRRRVNTLLLY